MVVLFVFNWHIQFQTYPAKFLINLLQPHISSRSTVTDTFTFFWEGNHPSINLWEVIICFELGICVALEYFRNVLTWMSIYIFLKVNLALG